MALLTGFLCLKPTNRLHWKWALSTVAASALPVVAYLAFRWPAVQASMALPSGPYSASFDNVMPNALAYFAYPFMPSALEMVSMSLLPSWEWGLGLAIHAGLIALLMKRFGFAASLAYLCAYFVFLAPLLGSPSLGAHYLYASGLPMALVLAVLPRSMCKIDRVGVGLVMTAGFILVIHGQTIQGGLYRQGQCQLAFLSSSTPQARALIAGGATMVRIEGEPGAMTYVALRATYGRALYAPGGEAALRIDGEPAHQGEASLFMRKDCSVEASRLQIPHVERLGEAVTEAPDAER